MTALMMITIWVTLTNFRYQNLRKANRSMTEITFTITEWISSDLHRHTLSSSARVLSRKQRFSPRGKFVTHLTTHENRESNDLLCQANCCEKMFRPISEDFTSSVERKTHFLNQSHHEETIIMDPATRSQSNLSTTSSNSYPSNSTPVASSNRHSPSLFGIAPSPSSQSSQFNDETSSTSARFTLGQLDTSSQ